MKIVGHNLKRIREKMGLSLRDTAKKTSISPSFLSQIENGKTSPSLSTLKKIADALETTIGSLIGEEIAVKEDVVVRKDDREELSNIGEGMRISLLTSQNPFKQMEPLLFVLDEGATSGESFYKHYGQEFILVLRGAMEIILNSTKYILKKGDSMYFNSNVPHSFRNVAKDKTEVVWVVTPPSF